MKKLFIALMLLSPVAVFAQKFGHVNSQNIVSNLPEVVKISGILQDMSKQKEEELTTMQDEFKRKCDDYDKKKSTMNANAQKETEASLQEEYERIQQLAVQSQQEIEAKRKEMLEPLLEKVKTAIKNVGKAGQYTYIFEQDAALYVGVGSKDLTNEIKAELNRLK